MAIYDAKTNKTLKDVSEEQFDEKIELIYQSNLNKYKRMCENMDLSIRDIHSPMDENELKFYEERLSKQFPTIEEQDNPDYKFAMNALTYSKIGLGLIEGED